MHKLKLFSLGLMIIAGIFGCERSNIDLPEELPKDAPSIQECPPGGCTSTHKCYINCPYGGFRVKVTEGSSGAIRYTYEPMNYIYVDHAYHTANYPNSSTSNPYTFDYFVLVNTVNSPTSPWKDVNGNVIMGSVYAYRLKNPQCLSVFNTNWLYGLSNPCDLNSALLHLNQASSKPSSGCGNPNIICPAPPIISVPHVPQKPFKVPPRFNIYYGYDCTPTSNGVCFLRTHPGPDDLMNPAIGPVGFEYHSEDNMMQVNFWRDPQTTELEIHGSNTLLDENIIFYYQLDPSTKIKSGTYEVMESDYGYGYAMLELDN